MNVMFSVSNDGGKTTVKCSEDMQECLNYCDLQNVGGGNYVVIVARKKVDLNTCKPGDILVSKHGLKLTYLSKAPKGFYYDHFVIYPNGDKSSRTNDGYVYKNLHLETDEDIVEIIPC